MKKKLFTVVLMDQVTSKRERWFVKRDIYTYTLLFGEYQIIMRYVWHGFCRTGNIKKYVYYKRSMT